jgi:hypothetical protein
LKLASSIAHPVTDEAFVLKRGSSDEGTADVTLKRRDERTLEMTVEEDGSGLGSGVYFYRLESGTASAAGRMLLLR